MYTGPDQEVNMILPLGNEADNFTYEIGIKVEDRFQFGTLVRLKVKVRDGSRFKDGWARTIDRGAKICFPRKKGAEIFFEKYQGGQIDLFFEKKRGRSLFL